MKSVRILSTRLCTRERIGELEDKMEANMVMPQMFDGPVERAPCLQQIYTAVLKDVDN